MFLKTTDMELLVWWSLYGDSSSSLWLRHLSCHSRKQCNFLDNISVINENAERFPDLRPYKFWWNKFKLSIGPYCSYFREASFWLFCSVMHFRAMLLPLVALVGRSSFGMLKLHLPQPQSLTIRWMMIVPMATVQVGVLYLVVYVVSVQATAFLLTPVSLPAMFQLLLKVIRSRFMHLLWMEVECFLFQVELKRYIFVSDAYWELVMNLHWIISV